jgi:NADPH:quinone reductase-like Zn-dependent oxidoreductase
VLVLAANAVPLPPGMGFNEAALLPMQVLTTWPGWYGIGLPRETKFAVADKQGLLVWGGRGGREQYREYGAAGGEGHGV